MNKEQQLLIDEAYSFFCKETFTKNAHIPIIFSNDDVPMKERFVNKCKTDKEFSEKWELKIEERELSLEERYDIHKKYITEDKLDLMWEPALKKI